MNQNYYQKATLSFNRLYNIYIKQSKEELARQLAFRDSIEHHDTTTFEDWCNTHYADGELVVKFNYPWYETS